MYNKMAQRRLNQQQFAEGVDSVVRNAVSTGRIVGVVVEIARDGERIYRRAVGFADREAGRAMSSDALFRWASLTKAVTSIATLALVDRGDVALDEPVTTYLPAFRPSLRNGAPATITIRHLLTHTSGVSYGLFEKPDGPYHGALVSDGLDQPGLSIEENLSRLTSVPLLFAPGSAWSYSLSTDVLGAVLAVAAGAPLPKLLKTLVTDPLGMCDTSFQVHDAARLTTAYADGSPVAVRMRQHHELPFGEGTISFASDRVLDAASYPSGGGGLIGTANDFLKLLESVRLRTTPGLSADSFERLTKIATGALATFQPGWGWSLGWSVLANPFKTGTPQSPGTWLWGGVYGNSWFVDPAKRLSVVGLTNTAVAGMLGAFPDALRNAIYAEL